jgi:hypothetical protein
MPGPSPLTSTPNTLACFTASEIRRLVWLRGIVAAECHLVPVDQPCPDHSSVAAWPLRSGCESPTASRI